MEVKFECNIQYSPKIMHAQEVVQEVLAPQEHAIGQKTI